MHSLVRLPGRPWSETCQTQPLIRDQHHLISTNQGKMKIKNRLIGLFGFLLPGIISGCEKDELNKSYQDFEYIKYGISFGECLGYCKRSIDISDSDITFMKKGWEIEGTLPDITLTEPLDDKFWTQLIEKIDFADFSRLDSIIGCPDCADGGAEWIEIKKAGQVHKIIFENRNEPKAVKDYIGILRTYLQPFDMESSDPVDFNNRTFIDLEGTIRNSVCSRGCNQYLVELVENKESSYYFDLYLEEEFKMDGLSITFNGVLQFDSTMIYSPAPNDLPVEEFKARNIRTFDVRTTED